MKEKQIYNKGFSLIELLVSIAILAIIMAAMGSYLSSTLRSQDVVSKQIQCEDEAQRVYFQLSDILMQATYVRVQPDDQYGYVYDNTEKKVDESTKQSMFADLASVDLNKIYYISENYPNYQLSNDKDAGVKKIIVDYTNGYLYNESDKKYPCKDSWVSNDDEYKTSGRVIDTDDIDNGNILKSFRVLHDDATSTKYYVIPKYIYIEYSQSDTVADTKTKVTQNKYDGTGTTEVDVVTSSTAKKSYVIFKYNKSDNMLYMYRFNNDGTASVPDATHRYATAKAIIDDMTKYDNTSDRRSVKGLISSNIQHLYISADPDRNSFDVDMNVANNKYKDYSYNMNETVNFRNHNVLTTKPQLLLKWTGKSGSSPTPTPPTP